MEEVILKHEHAMKALTQLQLAIQTLHNQPPEIYYSGLRDSVIKRFEFTIDTLQKFLKSYLVFEHGLNEDIMSPRNIFRYSLESEIVNQEQFEALIDAIEDRNRTSHTYNEKLAEIICQRIYTHESVMCNILKSFSVFQNKIMHNKKSS